MEHEFTKTIKKILQEKFGDSGEQVFTGSELIQNVAILIERFEEAVAKGYLNNMLNEIIKQSRLEFNYDDEEESLEIELLDSSIEDE